MHDSRHNAKKGGFALSMKLIGTEFGKLNLARGSCCLLIDMQVNSSDNESEITVD